MQRRRRYGGDRFVVQLLGVSHSTNRSEIIAFLTGCSVLRGEDGIHRTTDEKESTTKVYVELRSSRDVQKALSLNMNVLNGHRIRINRASWKDINNKYSRLNAKHHTFWVVRMTGLSSSTTSDDIIRFYKDINVDKDDVYLVRDHQDRGTGECYVQLRSLIDYENALKFDERTISTHGRINPRCVRVYCIESSKISKTRELLKDMQERLRSSRGRGRTRSRMDRSLSPLRFSPLRNLSPLLDFSPLLNLSPLRNLSPLSRSDQFSPDRIGVRQRSPSYDRLDWNSRSRSSSVLYRHPEPNDDPVPRRSNVENQWDMEMRRMDPNYDNPNNNFNAPNDDTFDDTQRPNTVDEFVRKASDFNTGNFVNNNNLSGFHFNHMNMDPINTNHFNMFPINSDRMNIESINTNWNNMNPINTTEMRMESVSMNPINTDRMNLAPINTNQMNMDSINMKRQIINPFHRDPPIVSGPTKNPDSLTFSFDNFGKVNSKKLGKRHFERNFNNQVIIPDSTINNRNNSQDQAIRPVMAVQSEAMGNPFTKTIQVKEEPIHVEGELGEVNEEAEQVIWEPNSEFPTIQSMGIEKYFLEVKAHIVHIDYPNRTLQDREINQLSVDILDVISSVHESNLFPRFLRSHKYRGGVLVVCQNVLSYNWLQNVIGDIQPKGCPLRIIEVKSTTDPVKFSARIPYHVFMSTNDILYALKMQNRSLRTYSWKLVEEKFDGNDRLLVWLIDDPLSVRSLGKQMFQVHLGLTKIELRRCDDGSELQN